MSCREAAAARRRPCPAAEFLTPVADEVRATLATGGCPLPLITRCEQAYRAASRQAGFDGPYLIELSMLRLLVTIYQVSLQPQELRSIRLVRAWAAVLLSPRLAALTRPGRVRRLHTSAGAGRQRGVCTFLRGSEDAGPAARQAGAAWALPGPPPRRVAPCASSPPPRPPTLPPFCASPGCLPPLQLLDDPYLLAKFKSEISGKRARQNDFTRTLADVSRTLRDLGLYHVVQVGGEGEGGGGTAGCEAVRRRAAGKVGMGSSTLGGPGGARAVVLRGGDVAALPRCRRRWRMGWCMWTSPCQTTRWLSSWRPPPASAAAPAAAAAAGWRAWMQRARC